MPSRTTSSNKNRSNKMKWATQKEYLALPGTCPACSSCDIVGDSIVVEENEVYQRVSCSVCNAVWMDIYKLIAYERKS